VTIAKNSMEGKAEPFLKRIENLHADAEEAKAVYMNECKERREDIKSVYEEAKDAGVPLKALKGLVKRRQLIRKADAIPAGLDIDEQSAYAQLVEALGELGMAAAKAAGHDVDDDDDRDFRGSAQKQVDRERADEAALAGVGRG
jgi:uncharacterized protein (UPF0335 family)